MSPPTTSLLDSLRGVLADHLELDPCKDLPTLVRAPHPNARSAGPDRDASLFSEFDLKDVRGLASQLTAKADPVSSFLYDQFKPATLDALAALDGSASGIDAAGKLLIAELNAMLEGASLWTDLRFAGVSLRTKTEDLRRSNPTGTSLRRLNKRLLEDAYPHGIRRNDLQRFWIRDGSQRLVFRVSERLDVSADAWVVDHELGTLALIHHVDDHDDSPVPSNPPRKLLSERMSRRIGEAAYLRHLLLEELRPGETQHHRSPFAVEVVFVLADPTLALWFNKELRSVTRDVSLLHAIGVSLLVPRGPAAIDRFQPSDIHRAFSWLLAKAREWMASPQSGAASSPATEPASTLPQGLPSTLILKNFRLRGSRRWQFAPGQALHLVHGHNGSGKSSFVEAIELITTGRIEKLGPADCQAVITNRTILAKRRSPGPIPRAAVMLRYPGAPPPAAPTQASPRPAVATTSRLVSWRLTTLGVDAALAPGFVSRSGAFRLNQEVIKLLSRASEKEQAKILLETFFPEGYALVTESQRSLRQREETLGRLPPRLRQQFENGTGTFDESKATAALSWVQPTGIPWDRLALLLPLDSSQLSALLPLLPLTVESSLHRTGTAPSWEPILGAAKEIDDSLRGLLNQATSLSNSLRAAQAFLTAYQDVAATAADDSDRQLPDLFADWLLRLAATDILKREHDLLTAVQSVASPGADAYPPDMIPALASASVLESQPKPAGRSDRLRKFQALQSEALAKVTGFVSFKDRHRQQGVAAPPLAEFDLGALDTLATAGVFGREFVTATPRLSEAVRVAFQKGKAEPIIENGTTLVSIGAPGAFRTLASRLEGVAAALTALEAARAELASPQGGLVNTLQQFQSLQRIAGQQQKTQAEAAARFRERLQTPLGAALNEFTAMLTPARWAYDDIVSRIDDKDTSPSLDFVQDNQPAPLRLNTAQLSTFALAFFLLCNRAREHPLRLGILDDPFENMDELTVTTVARGLGRFLRLRRGLGDGPDSWQLLLFLHGEQNVERVRREIPCATYFLPWLSPGAELGKEPVIQAEKSQIVGDTLQDLTRILTDTRSRVASTPRPLAT